MGWRYAATCRWSSATPGRAASKVEQAAAVAARLFALGCTTISLGDTIGVATAGQVQTVLQAVVAAGVPLAQVALHLHDTYGQALANVLAGLESGVREFDASAGGLGGCPYAKSATGNLATEDLVWMLDGLGIAHGVDLRAVVRTSRWLADRLGRPSPSRVVAALSELSRCARFAAEGGGVADIDDFDIDRSIAAAWAEFQVRLSEIVSMIDESADLTIGTGSAGDGAPFLRLSSPRPHVVRGEAASNAVLGEDFQLKPDQLATMEALGWQPPAVDGRPGRRQLLVRARPGRRGPDQRAGRRGAPGRVRRAASDLPGSGPAGRAAAADSRLRWRAPPWRWPGRSRTWSPYIPRDQRHLDELVDAELGRMFGYPPIHDTEGDVAIRVGSTMLFLRTAPDAQEVIVFAAVVHDVAGRSRAAEVLNDLNVEARWVKFQLVRDRVFVTVSVLARPFVPAHLHQAVQILAETADGIDDELAVKLGGRTTFDDHDEEP